MKNMLNNQMSLKAAREAGRPSEFIDEREAEEAGDRNAMVKVISSMAGTSSEASKASPRRKRGG